MGIEQFRVSAPIPCDKSSHVENPVNSAGDAFDDGNIEDVAVNDLDAVYPRPAITAPAKDPNPDMLAVGEKFVDHMTAEKPGGTCD